MLHRAGRRIGAVVCGTAVATAFFSDGPAAAGPQRPRWTQRPRAVIVGGGCAGAGLAQSLERWADVTMIDRKPYFEYTPAITRGLLGRSFTEDAVDSDEELRNWCRKYFVPHRFYLNHTRIVVGDVVELTPEAAVLRSGRAVQFDFCIIATGGGYAPLFRNSDATTVPDRVKELARFNQMVGKCKRVVVVGGNAGGVECTAELKHNHPDLEVVLLHPRQHVLHNQGPKLGRYAQWRLRRNGVDVRLLSRAENIRLLPPGEREGGRFSLTVVPTDREGHPLQDAEVLAEELRADFVLNCTGVRPNTGFLRRHFADSLNERGFIVVNSAAQLQGHPHIFAVGDCAMPSGPGVKTLAAIAEQTSQLASNLVEIVGGNRVDGKMASSSSGHKDEMPLQFVTLGHETSDGVGKAPLLGSLRGWLARYVSRKNEKAFLRPFVEPAPQPRAEAVGLVENWFKWKEKAETFPRDFAHGVRAAPI